MIDVELSDSLMKNACTVATNLEQILAQLLPKGRKDLEELMDSMHLRPGSNVPSNSSTIRIQLPLSVYDSMF